MLEDLPAGHWLCECEKKLEEQASVLKIQRVKKINGSFPTEHPDGWRATVLLRIILK